MDKKTPEHAAGFGIVEVVIAVAVIALLGFIGWKVYDVLKNKPTSATTTNRQGSSSSSGGTTTTTPADPYAGWKTYTSSVAGYSVRYPSGWSVRTTTSNSGDETLFITSPDQFEIRLDSGRETTDPSADVCGSTCLATDTLTTFTAPKYGKLMISADKQGAGGGSLYALDLFTSSGSLSIVSPTKTNITTTATGLFQGLSEQQHDQETLGGFTGSSSVKTAQLIYESLAY